MFDPAQFLPPAIFEKLRSGVLGQDEALRYISVALYRHLRADTAGNLLLIGNSGTGKTTIMKAIRRFYDGDPDLAEFRVMVIMNANMLAGEDEADVNCRRLFKGVEDRVRALAGGATLTAADLERRMERATICLDEVDKIAAQLAGKTNVAGLAIQQALLTIMEGEQVVHETVLDGKPVRLLIDTGKLLFICGGAFEELYDQVRFQLADPNEKRKIRQRIVMGKDGITFESNFALRDYLEFEDLFRYGMTPQFISRFSSLVVLNDLRAATLQQIMLTAVDSPWAAAVEYFAGMGIDLALEPGSIELIATHAEKNVRIGARALREILAKITTPLEFDPTGSPYLAPAANGRRRLLVPREQVERTLRGD